MAGVRRLQQSRAKQRKGRLETRLEVDMFLCDQTRFHPKGTAETRLRSRDNAAPRATPDWLPVHKHAGVSTATERSQRDGVSLAVSRSFTPDRQLNNEMVENRNPHPPPPAAGSHPPPRSKMAERNVHYTRLQVRRSGPRGGSRRWVMEGGAGAAPRGRAEEQSWGSGAAPCLHITCSSPPGACAAAAAWRSSGPWS